MDRARHGRGGRDRALPAAAAREGAGCDEGRVRRPVQRQRTRLDEAAQGVVRRIAEEARNQSRQVDASQTSDIRGVLEKASHEDNQLVIARRQPLRRRRGSRCEDDEGARAGVGRTAATRREASSGRSPCRTRRAATWPASSPRIGLHEKTRDHRDRRRLRLGHGDVEPNGRRLRRRGSQHRPEREDRIRAGRPERHASREAGARRGDPPAEGGLADGLRARRRRDGRRAAGRRGDRRARTSTSA